MSESRGPVKTKCIKNSVNSIDTGYHEEYAQIRWDKIWQDSCERGVTRLG